MHFHSLAVIQIPYMEEDMEENAKVSACLAQLEQQYAADPKNIVYGFYIEKLKGNLNSFAREVFSSIDSLMHPYGSESEDCYEFCNQKDQVQSDYENRSCDCVRLPDGRIVSRYDYAVSGKFEIRNGQVYERKSGQLKQSKRTHKAKKMKALPDYPFKKLYKTMHDYAIDYCNYEYDEESHGYGFYCNPYAMWDWFQIGGRWPVTFLVKDTCTEYSYGERSWGNNELEYPAPEGYMWVSAARKKDIEWAVMKDWYIQQAKKRFNALEAMFVSRLAEPDDHLRVEDGCVYSYWELIYKIGETEEEYLNRLGYPDSRQYPVSFCDLIDENHWNAQEHDYKSPENDEVLAQTWEETIQQYIDDLDDDDVLVSIDYHM